MSVYLKHVGAYKYNQLKGRSYDEIQKLFDKEMKRVNSFVALNSEAQEISGKMMKVVQEKECFRVIDREDLQTLWKLVKTKHGDTRPEDEHERVLWGDLKVMFEPDIKSDVWRNLQGYKCVRIREKVQRYEESKTGSGFRCTTRVSKAGTAQMLGLNMLVLFAVWAQKTFTTACGNNFEVNIVGFAHEKVQEVFETDLNVLRGLKVSYFGLFARIGYEDGYLSPI
ncbi:hypothetical protein Tco_1352294 [Tanacetum coccineum]